MTLKKTLTISKLGTVADVLAATKLETMAVAVGVGKRDGKLTPAEFKMGKAMAAQLGGDLFLDAEKLESRYSETSKNPSRSWNPVTRWVSRFVDLFSSTP